MNYIGAKIVIAGLLLFIGFAPIAHAVHVELIDKIIRVILKPAANLLLVLATLIFFWGIVEYIAGASNETARTTGRNHILWGTVGLMIMISVQFILSIISSFFYP